MRTSKCRKLLLFVFIIVAIMIIFNTNLIYAEINSDYPGVDSVTHEGVSEAISGSDWLDWMAKLIFAVARWLESLIGWVFSMLSGTSDFPWADKIVFNAVPLLDVNFINPAPNSFADSIQDVLQSLYSTIMTIAVGFFGMTILITAIKLVITSIADEKTKYKKAIVQWLTGFVMLFCIHYFISFVFYLNEQLVKVASNIVTERLEVADNAVSRMRYEAVAGDIIDEARMLEYEYNGEKISDILEDNPELLEVWINHIVVKGADNGLYSAMIKFGSKEENYQDLAMMIKWAADKNISVDELKELRANIKSYRSETRHGVAGETGKYYYTYSYWQAIGGPEYINGEETLWAKLFSSIEERYRFIKRVLSTVNFDSATVYAVELEDNKNVIYSSSDVTGNVYYTTGGHEKLNRDGLVCQDEFAETIKVDCDVRGSSDWSTILGEMIILKSSSSTAGGTGINAKDVHVRIITELASYFRNTVYKKTVYSNVGSQDDKGTVYIQNMIMYAVLVGQSLILFIAYIKRLFYVIMLAMISPIVVVVDFFQKFGK